MDIVTLLSGSAGLCLALIVWSMIADRRRMRRSDPDRVGLVNWPTVQVFALILGALFAFSAWTISR
ncbi:hypothetical protein BH09PSE4_BH09PSE4_01080 [soil metagenome]